ncbi:mfs monocarboxylate [Moniliophthora roreri]|nr:mfs monocarboxylate [Moniliophthora roreri]
MDSLQDAAQRYSWLYMIHTLGETVKDSEDIAFKDLKRCSTRLRDEEADIHDQRIRYQAEKDIELLDALGKEQLKDILKEYLIHEQSSLNIMNEVIDLSAKATPKQGAVDLETEDGLILELFNNYLEKLENLITQSDKLHDTISQLADLCKLTAISSAPCPTRDTDAEGSTRDKLDAVHGVLGSILPVLNARKENLRLAHSLLEESKGNWANCVRMESLLASKLTHRTLACSDKN